MLWFQARAGDFSPRRQRARPAELPILNRTSRCWFLAILLLSVVLGVSSLAPCASGSIKRSQRKALARRRAEFLSRRAKSYEYPTADRHEAKGLVLPISTPKDICGENSKRERPSDRPGTRRLEQLKINNLHTGGSADIRKTLLVGRGTRPRLARGFPLRPFD